jgi:nuclear transport factor 2 (NTF2) superfamily protein
LKLREKKSMLDLLMILATTLLIECGAVLHFYETSICANTLGNSGRITSFDMDKDGQLDYWQRFDHNGRKVELSFSQQSGEPNEVVQLDRLTSREVPHFIVALDGVPYELVEELHQQGRFRLFYPPSRVVTCFPGMTNPAFQLIFGGKKPIAYESEYFDRNRNRLISGNDLYLSGQAANWAKSLDYRCSPELDALSYIKPDLVFKYELQQITDVFRKAWKNTGVVYLMATAGLGTRGGREAILKYLRRIDQWCEQIVYERRGRVKISLLADHGHSASGQGRASFKKLLEENGYRLTDRVEEASDVVTVEFGLVSYAAYYTEDPAGVAAALLTDSRTTLACYPVVKGRTTVDGLGVVVQTTDGKATVRKKQGRFGYEVEYGDPLELSDIIEQLQRKGRVDSDGFIDDRAMFEATLNHIYPDPLRRVWQAFNGLVEKPAELVICLKDGWVHGSGLFYSVIGKVASTHGSLSQSNSVTFAMTMLGELPPALRLEEVMPNLKKLHRD